jgi:tetratricopeptide (TPR) repeat protein
VTGNSINKERRVIPRWRHFTTSAELGELDHFGRTESRAAVEPASLWDLLDQWKDEKSDALAGELLAATWMNGDQSLSREAAIFILRPNTTASPQLQELATSVLEESPLLLGNQGSEREAIRNLRAVLRHAPNDAISWAELARFYIVSGNLKKAYRCIVTALGIAPNDRYILRAASRCLIHLGETERALDALMRAPRIQIDPWIMAASLAVSSILKRSTRQFKTAKTLQNADLSPFHLSELRAALATIEIEAGNAKGGKKFLSAALKEPTENVVAQAWWAKEAISFPAPTEFIGVPHGFEADTKANIAVEQWELACKSCKAWFSDEPFSSRPAVSLSFIHAVAFEEHQKAIEAAETALVANPDDPLLLNNLAFSLASIGKLEKARLIATNSLLLANDTAAAIAPTATMGLIEFRSGNTAAGESFYKSAAQIAAKHKAKREESLVYLYKYREEKRLNMPSASSSLRKGLELAGKITDPSLLLVKDVVVNGPKARTGSQTP